MSFKDDDFEYQKFKQTLLYNEFRKIVDEDKTLYKLYLAINRICTVCQDDYVPCTCMRDD